MQVTETSADGLKREFTVVVPAADVETRLVDRLTEIGHSVKVPGFRPGKVPITLLKKRYGDAVRGEVLEQTVQESWQKAMTDKGLRPASEPKIEIVAFDDGVDLEYKMAVELLPEIAPVDLSKLALERPVARVSDDDVEAALKRMAEGRRVFEAVADGRAAREGDQVVIDFVGRVDGEAFAGGEVNGFEIEIGSHGFLPGFEEQLVGCAAGTRKDIAVTVADDHPNEKLRGKEVVFDVTVKEVREPKPVAIDDSLAQAAGLESLEAMKAAIRDQLEREYAAVSRARLKRALLDKLAEAHDFALPQGIIDGEFEAIWSQVKEAMDKDQLDEDDKGKSEDELKERYRAIAERRVRLGLLLSEIGRANNIAVSQEDLSRAMHQEAMRFPGQEAKVIEYFQKNPAAMREIEAPIFEDKVIDFIIEMAQVSDREVSVDELYRDPDEAAADDGGSKDRK